jgi:peptidoglycan/LPS O-acetylase OafA/YrhL
MTQPANRFDFLRLVFACGVFLYHAVVLASLDVGGVWEARLAVLAETCIQGFFIVSGALVYGSWERSQGLSDYAGKRVRRLYPAYLVIILVPAAIGLALSFDFGAVGRYLAANLVFLNFLEPNLPGVFAENRFTEVNGALWTLKIEVLFYMCVPILAFILTGMKRLWWLGLAVLYLGGVVWALSVPQLIEGFLGERIARQLPGQMAYFASGMVLWRFWDWAKAQSGLLLLTGGLVTLVSFLIPFGEVLRAAGLAALIAGIAFMPGPALNAARWGDVSYGVYIVHFPILQAMVAFGVFTQLGAVGGFAAATVLVFGLSYGLWWLIEKPALRPDSHYRQVSKTE